MAKRSLLKNLWKRSVQILCCFTVGLLLTIFLAYPSESFEYSLPFNYIDIENHISAGLIRYRQGDIQTAIATWQQLLQNPLFHEDPSANKYYPLLLQYIARGHQDIGNNAQQVNTLEQLINYYQEAGDTLQWGRMQTEKAAAYQRQGNYQQAEALLCHRTNPVTLVTDISFPSHKALVNGGDVQCDDDSSIGLAIAASDKTGELAAWGQLGNGYWQQGEYDLAIAILSSVLEYSQSLADQPYAAALLNSLGGTYASLGQQHYRYAELAKKSGDQGSQHQQEEQARFYDKLSTTLFEASFEDSRDHRDRMGELHSLLNLVPIYQRSFPDQLLDRVQSALEEATRIFNQLPLSHDRIQLGLKLALFWQSLHAPGSALSENLPTCPVPLATGALPLTVVTSNAFLIELEGMARHLKDDSSIAEILGQRGHLAACSGQDHEALGLFYQAQLASDRPEQHYRWTWQAAQLLEKQGKIDEAIAFYEEAIQSLDRIRDDLTGSNRDLQLNLRDQVEEIYRQFVSLKLQQMERSQPSGSLAVEKYSSPSSSSTDQQILGEVLESIDGLRLTELQNYIGDDCELPLLDHSVDHFSSSLRPQTAVFNSIILPDRIAIILTTAPTPTTKHYSLQWISIGQDEFITFINDFRFNLEKRSDLLQRFRPQAQKLYDWMIQPFESELKALDIDSLIFIHDGLLRSIPMAVLHDGTRFLTQKYDITNTPSLKLAPSDTLQLSKADSVLAFGLTQLSAIAPPDGPVVLPPNAPSFSFARGTVLTPLPAVRSELKAIQDLFPKSTILLDTDFTRNRLQKEISTESPQILHLATHARFGFDAEQTYLVTGQKAEPSSFAVEGLSDAPKFYNETIDLNDLYRLVKQTNIDTSGLDFLVLTACETAVGNDRDALGLAGIALQAGVKSSIASLWQVDDQVTADLIRQFYQGLSQGLTKAEALRNAQEQWLAKYPTGRYSHPGYWAPFVLLGREGYQF